MTSNTDFLLGIRAAMKFQDSLLKQLSETYGLTLIEANVITFLKRKCLPGCGKPDTERALKENPGSP